MNKERNSQLKIRENLQWINCAKAIAIIAVLVDHSMGILYTDYRIQAATDWDVAVFILVSGITSYMSNSRSNLKWGKAYLKSVKKILEAYLICSAICLVIKTHGFDLKTYIYQLVHFIAAFPLYFVALYLQLMLASRPIFNLLQKCPRNGKGYMQEGILLCVISGIASLTTNHTQILDIYYGGGKVLGGTNLIIFYLGMLMAKHEWFVKESRIKSVLIWVFSSIGWLLWWKNIFLIRNVIDRKMIWFGSGYDIPNVAIGGFSILTLLVVYATCKILEMSDATKKIIIMFSWLGEHTLYIFMLHATILYFCIMPYLIIENIWLKRIVYMVLMIIVPLMVEYAINVLIKKMIMLVQRVKNQQKKS